MDMATNIAPLVRYKGKKPANKRGVPMSPAQMRERSLAQNKAIRAWAEKRGLGTKPGTYPG